MRTVLTILVTASLSAAAEDAEKLWTTKVQPLLTERCIQCHGPEKSKGKLRLDSLDAMLKGGRELGPAVVPGNPDGSSIVKVCLLPRDDEMAMPPEGKSKPLTPEEVGWLKAWIAGGAPVPAARP